MNSVRSCSLNGTLITCSNLFLFRRIVNRLRKPTFVLWFSDSNNLKRGGLLLGQGHYNRQPRMNLTKLKMDINVTTIRNPNKGEIISSLKNRYQEPMGLWATRQSLKSETPQPTIPTNHPSIWATRHCLKSETTQPTAPLNHPLNQHHPQPPQGSPTPAKRKTSQQQHKLDQQPNG